jgi:ubiquitin-conjugating enzyme E2 S
MKLVLGRNFPSEPPKGFFLTKIFHPNVAKNGDTAIVILVPEMYSSKKVLLQKNNGSESSRIFTKVGMELH